MTQAPLRVLAIAFACDPERGSESAGGWGTVQALSEFADVTVLMHPRHAGNVSAWEAGHTNPRLHFIAVPTVTWGLWMQRFTALSRFSWLARYVGWLSHARSMATSLHEQQPFDVAVHASLGMYWLPSTIVQLPIPAVWGPVSGGARSPRSLRPFLGRLGPALETVELLSGRAMLRLPWQRRTWEGADVRLVETSTVRNLLPERVRERTHVVNRAVLSKVGELPDVPRQRYIAFTSPLERRKGPRLALAALAKTPTDVRLRIIHHGPEEEELKAMAQRLGVADRVDFCGKVPREEMWRTVVEAAACLFTGLREEGGCALAEAMLAGTPVVVLDHAGAGVVAHCSTDEARTALISPTGPEGTATELAAAMTRFSRDPAKDRSPFLDQSSTKQALWRGIEEAIATGKAPEHARH